LPESLYGKAFEYLLQVSYDLACPDANAIQLCGSHVQNMEQLEELMKSKGLTLQCQSAIDFPLSMSAVRAKCNVGQIQVRMQNSHVYLSADRVDAIIASHAALRTSKHPKDAVRLANNRICLDSFKDMLSMHYSWVDSSSLRKMVKMAKELGFAGVFEHRLAYMSLHGKVDLLCEDKVVDFKLGKQSHDHILQMSLYSAMHHIETQLPAIGTLYYPRDGVCIDVSVEDPREFLNQFIKITEST